MEIEKFPPVSVRVRLLKNFRKLSCYQQAFFLYTLIRYYRIHPDAYTASRADRLKVYLRLYVTYKYPGCEAEIEMQSRMLNLWYLLKEQKTF